MNRFRWFILVLPFLVAIMLIPEAFAVTFPAGILFYQQAAMASGNTMTANTQIMTTFNAGAIPSADWGAIMQNLEAFNGVSGNVLDTWIENSNSITSNTITLWILNPDGGWITDNNIYIGLAGTSTNFYSKTGQTGIASNLTTGYGTYDNGNIIFPYYQTFGGHLPTGWQLGGSGASTSFTTRQTLVTTPGGSWGGIFLATSSATGTALTGYETDIYMSQSSGNNQWSVGSSHTIPADPCAAALWDITWTGTSADFCSNGATTSSSTPVSDTANFIQTFYYPSALTGNFYLGYSQMQASPYPISTAQSGTYFGVWGGYATATEAIQWARTRVAPTNGIMPSTTFGTLVSTSYTPPSISKPVVSNSIADVGQTETISATITGGTANYAGNFLVSNSVPSLTQELGIIPQSSTALSTSWTVSSNEIGNSNTGNFIGVDSNTIPTGFNSIPSSTFTVNPAQIANVLLESNTIINMGQSSTLTAGVIGGTPGYTFNWFNSGGCSGSSVHTGTTYTVTPLASNTYSFNSVDSASTNNAICSGSNTVTVTPLTMSFSNFIVLGGTNTITASIAMSHLLTLNVIIPGSITPITLASGTGSLSYNWIYPYNSFLGQYTLNAFDTVSGLAVTNTLSVFSDPFFSNTMTTVEYPANSYPFSTNSPYPYKLSANGGTFGGAPVTFNLNYSYNLATNTPALTGVTSYSYFLPPNALTGNYVFHTKEIQLGNSIVLNASIGTNMLIFNSKACTPGLTASSSPGIQYFPEEFNSLTQNCWYSVPSTYTINTYSNTTSANIVDVKGSNTLILTDNLVSKFNQFSPTYSFNLTSQTGFIPANIGILPFAFYTSNTGAPGNYLSREIVNETNNDQGNFMSIFANQSGSLSLFFNNYTIPFRSFNFMNANTFQIYIPESTFQNPTLTILNGTLTGTKPTYFPEVNNFCPSSISNSQFANWPSYLVESSGPVPGSQYTLNLYSSGGYLPAGYYMIVNEFNPITSLDIGVQSYKIPTAAPFSLPFINEGTYQFVFYTGGCGIKVYFSPSAPLLSPPGPIVITVPQNITIPSFPNVILNKTCVLTSNTIANTLTLTVIGNESDNLGIVQKWNVKLINITSILNTSNLISNLNFTGTSFSHNFSILGISAPHAIITASWGYPGNVVSQTDGLCVPTLHNPITPQLPGLGLLVIFMFLAFTFIPEDDPQMTLVFAVVGVFAMSSVFLFPITTDVFYALAIFAAVFVFLWETDRI